MTWAAVGAAAVTVIGGSILGNKAKKKQAKAQKKALKYQIFAEQQAREDLSPYRESGYQALNAYNRAMGLGQVEQPRDQSLSVNQIYSGQYGSFGTPQNAYAITPETRAQLASMGINIPAPPQQAAPTQDDRYGGFYASPGYQFRMDEGLNALDKSAAARGRLRSGGQNKAITRYAQGIAADEFGSYTNRLAQIAGLGGGAAGQSASQAIQSGQNIGNSMANLGATRASGYLNAANTVTGLGEMFGNAYNKYQQGRVNSVAPSSGGSSTFNPRLAGIKY